MFWHYFELDQQEQSFCTTLSPLLTELPLLGFNSVSNSLFLWRINYENEVYRLSLLIIKLCLKILYLLLLNVLYPRTHMINLCFSLVQQQQKIIFVDGCAYFQLSGDEGHVSLLFFFLNLSQMKTQHQIIHQIL